MQFGIEVRKIPVLSFKAEMTVVSGPWDGAAFGNERINLQNGYTSEYRYEYPVKTIQRTMSKGI